MSSRGGESNRGDDVAAQTHAECDVHPGEIEYPDSGCAKCRQESESAAQDRLCGRCGHFHGEDGCDHEVRDYGDMDCSCPGWAPAGRTKDGRIVVVCYCGGGDVHAHQPHGGGARILACPPDPIDRPEPSRV